MRPKKKEPDELKDLAAESGAVASGDEGSAKVKQRGVWKRFFHTMKVAHLPYGWLALFVVLTILEGFIIVKLPQINGNFFAGDVSPKSIAMFIGIELFSTVITTGMLFVNHTIRYRTNRNLRNVLWGKILKLKPSYFDKVTANTLISRITDDSDAINEFVMDIVIEGATQIYYLAITIAAMSAVSSKAGLMLLAFTPVSVLIAFISGRLSLKFENSAKFSMANMTEYLSELISCLPLLKAFNMQAYEARRGKKVSDDYFKANAKLTALDFGKNIVGTLFGILPEIVIILIGIKMLKESTVDAAGWYAFYLYAGTFIGFVGTLGGIWTRSKSIQGKLSKVSDILYEENEELGEYVEGIIADGDVMFDKVTFAYEEEPVLKDASFTIPGKQVTAIIGYSGFGKTTSAKLLERIYEPDEGRILMGGKDIKDCGIAQWREGIAYVMQDTPLLSGTIRDNLLYGLRREVTEEEINEAVKLVNLDKFIAESPEGLDREVGQFGESLSGGQRQKIAIASAILTGSPILILDEPTASLDIISTSEIVNTVKSLKGKRTVFMITHDREAVKAADHVIVAEEDRTFVEGDNNKVSLLSGFYNMLMKGGEAA